MLKGDRINRFLLILAVLSALVFLLLFLMVRQNSNFKQENSLDMAEKAIKDLYDYKIPDISEEEKVSAIIKALKFDGQYKYIGHNIYKDDDSNMIIFSLKKDITNPEKSPKSDLYYINQNTILLFALIGNLGEIKYTLISDSENVDILTQRRWANELFKGNIYEETKTRSVYDEMVEKLDNINTYQKPKNYKDIEVCISDVILTYNKDLFQKGEFGAQAHITYGDNTNMEGTKVYVVANYKKFQIINDTFEVVGEVEKPVVITFGYDKKNGYMVKDYKEAEDGNRREISLMELFPQDLIPQIKSYFVNTDTQGKIDQQIYVSAREYLDAIGKKDIDIGSSEKKYPDIKPENQMMYEVLASVYTDYPYFVGSEEKIENTHRYKYFTKHERVDDKDILTYEKIDANTGRKLEVLQVELENGNIKTTQGKLSDEFNSYYESLKNSAI